MSALFSETSCAGLLAVCLDSDISMRVVSKFNFANNSDSAGCFHLGSCNVQTLCSLHSHAQSPKWIYEAALGFFED